mgnify:CR=1 FL=1
MIQSGSTLQVIDNSGVLNAYCIRVLGNKKVARIGDKIIISVRSTKRNSRILKGSIHTALLVKTKKINRFNDGRRIQQNFNGIILLNNQINPVGNRVFSSVIRLNINKKNLDLNLLSFKTTDQNELFLKLNILSKIII